MLVVPDKRQLVLNTPVHAEVVAAIPHARAFDHGGDKLVAVPHGPLEAVVLKNMGFTVPPPILQYYWWPAKFTAMEHQRETAAFLTMNRRALCLNAPGSGKSISALWAADYLVECGVASKVLIVAPLSTLKPVWGMELFHHLPHRNFAIITGTRAKRIELLQTPGLQFAIINHDGFTNMAPHLHEFDLVIYDEATAVKTPGSQRYQVLSKWVNANNPWLWLLTGTPISQSPVDAWTLARLVNSPTVPRSFTAFRDLVMQRVTTFKWIPRSNALDVCKSVLQPSIRYSLDECVDLPDTNYVGRHCELTPAQQRAFKDMENKAVAMFAGTDVTAANAAVMLGKLLQICAGVVYDNAGDSLAIDASLRYDALTELLDEVGVRAGEKVILFVPLRGVQAWLESELVKSGYDVASVHGDVGKNERNKIFHDFQYTDSINVLLAHPKVAAHGLTLTRARNIVWYAPIYSLESYEQANARIRRLSTQGKTTVWHIYSTPFEKELYRRLQHKKKVLSEFLSMVKGVNDEL